MSIHRNQIIMRNILSVIILKITECNIIGFWNTHILHVLHGISPCTSYSYNQYLAHAVKLVIFDESFLMRLRIV